ncbi:hypothetical protein AVEN_166088-1 [Araneus ventricosus]|uniref:Mos1 transposase HTH domain-containing protein n=1 Tax=Araneus ventricosus TaxID=182803 RepID=A0A4Y2FQC0_ARAVE|nr:hypothetical protein AVEN_166088-1 [Araneus ventricosus]
MRSLPKKTEKQQTAVPEFSLVQISIAERRMFKTWSQMEVRAVMRYEWARGTSILDNHRNLQSVHGDDVLSRQMVGCSCSMFSEGGRCGWHQIGLHLPISSPTGPFIAHDNTHFHLRPRFEHKSFCHTDLH